MTEKPTAAEATPTEKGPVEVKATAASGKKVPGFEGLLAMVALVAIYLRRRRE
ncbi:MAG: hypothetical protein J7J06_10250 [Methanosarcinales archaeon]|nr:hypothetical protein [Methanosarcinales archaeon]